MKTRFYVTAKRIAYGKQGNCNECPVALAIQSKLKADYLVGVSSNIVIYKTANSRYINGVMQYDEKVWNIESPVVVYRFVRAFDDNTNKAEPFTFTLDIPKEFLKVA